MRQMDLGCDIFLMAGRLAGHAQEGDRDLAKLAQGGCRHMGIRSERLVHTRGQGERAAERLPGEQLGQTSVPADVRSGVQDASKARGMARGSYPVATAASMADLLDHVCAVGVGRWLDREKAWLEPLGGAIQIDPSRQTQ